MIYQVIVKQAPSESHYLAVKIPTQTVTEKSCTLRPARSVTVQLPQE